MRNLGRGKMRALEFTNAGSTTMPSEPQLGGWPLPTYLNLAALVPGACPVTPSHFSEPMSQPLLNCGERREVSAGGQRLERAGQD